MMDAPTEETEAFIPMESMININGGRNIFILGNSVTTTVRRKAAKRTEYLQEELVIIISIYLLATIS
jgi:hypothetical protein